MDQSTPTSFDFIATILSVLGAVFATVLSIAGSAIATAKKSSYILNTETQGYRRLDDNNINMASESTPVDVNPVRKALVGIVMAGAPAIYGLIIATMITTNVQVTLLHGVRHLGGGLVVGLSSLFSGYCLGQISNSGKHFIFSVLDIFGGALSLYGLIVAIILVNI